MQPDLRPIDAVWIIVVGVWAAAALRTKRTTQSQTGASPLVHMIAIVFSLLLLLNPWFAVGPLAWRLVRPSAALSYTGLALTVAGAAFAIWARLTLGRNWSGVVTIKQDHQIIQKGPYALVRHPIYSGFLLAMLGSAIVIGQMRCLVGFLIAFVSWRFKSRIEERFMEQQFGHQYAAYKQQVKAFIPFVL